MIIEGESEHKKVQAILAISGLAKTYLKKEVVLDIEERLTKLKEHLNLSENGTLKKTPHYN